MIRLSSEHTKQIKTNFPFPGISFVVYFVRLPFLQTSFVRWNQFTVHCPTFNVTRPKKKQQIVNAFLWHCNCNHLPCFKVWQLLHKTASKRIAAACRNKFLQLQSCFSLQMTTRTPTKNMIYNIIDGRTYCQSAVILYAPQWEFICSVIKPMLVRSLITHVDKLKV